MLELMKVLTGDNRFMDVYNESMEGGHTSMIDVFDKVLVQGREQGADEKSLVIINNLMKNHNMSFEEAAAFIGLDEDEKERLRNAMSKTA